MALQMSSKEIAVSTGGIENLIATIRKEWSELINLADPKESTQYKDLLTALNDNWVGKDCDQFKAQLDSLCKELRKKAEELCNAEVAAINNYKTGFDNAQIEIAQTIKF